jgi:hypothetical protein
MRRLFACPYSPDFGEKGVFSEVQMQDALRGSGSRGIGLFAFFQSKIHPGVMSFGYDVGRGQSLRIPSGVPLSFSLASPHDRWRTNAQGLGTSPK